jgi:hypothetical protein
MSMKSVIYSQSRFVFGCFIAIISTTGCQTGKPNVISHREPLPVYASQKAGSPAVEPAAEEAPKDLFVRRKELRIRSTDPVNETGSLTDLKDPRAYLFGFDRPLEVGQFIDVKITSNRAEGQASADAQSSGAGPAAPQADASGDAKTTVKPAEESALLKALPSLEPAGKNKPVLLKNIKMQILERFDNGDALVMYRRRSLRDGQGAELAVTARLSAEALARSDQIGTIDLADIDWRESINGEIVERKSANWEDEYSLRLSGFDELKSKDALGLEEKREMLKSARDKLENEMKGFSQERAKLAKERATLLEDKTKDQTKITELEQQKADLQKRVDDLSPKEEADASDETATKKPTDSARASPEKGSAKEKGAKAQGSKSQSGEKSSPKNTEKPKPAEKEKPADGTKKG